MRSIKVAKRLTITSVIFALVMLVGFSAYLAFNGGIKTARADSVITMTKTADHYLVPPGTTVNYTYTISYTNPQFTPTITLNDITDNKIPGNILSTCSNGGVLNPESGDVVCTASDVINEFTHNTATVSGTYDGGDSQVTDTAEAFVDVITITVDKIADPTIITEDGLVTYTVTITNNATDDRGNIELQTLTDEVNGIVTDLNGQRTCSIPEGGLTIGPGNNYQCTFQRPLTCEDGESVTDTVEAMAYFYENDITRYELRDSDDATVDIACPGITVNKTANPTDLTEDGDVEYTVSITNDSIDVDVTLEELEDNIYGDLNGQGDCELEQIITPGSTYTCSFSQEITCDEEPSVTDVVTARATYTDDAGVEYRLSDSDDATVNIACEDEENGDGDENGDVTPGLATIHGKVYDDTNQNGTLDVGESGLYNVTVALLDSTGFSITTDQTDVNGDFTFSDLDPATYGLRETDPTGYMSSTPNDISNIVVAANASSYHLFGDYTEEEDTTTPTTPTTPTQPTTTTPLPTTGPGDNPYPLFALLALVPLMASGYAFYRYKRK